ncbi:MAG: hypothetical protein Q7U10_01345 [Thermodesulfovibrionia bacterium]|nr:hypothetical protein [Thermodesulfovibrionia bacterium]
MRGRFGNNLFKIFITVFPLLTVALIAILTYQDILGCFFTGMDAISLIDTCRINSFSDIFRIFTEPGLNAIPDALNFHRWYRPISVLSYSMDYYMWKLDPFGYHLTDLILHCLVSVLVFMIVKFLANGRQTIAWLGAIIFTTHPLLVETVPANVRRMDILSTLFVLLSILSFFKYYSMKSRGRIYYLFSVLFYLIAIGAKEIAIILPPLVFSYVMISYFLDNKSIRAGLVQSLSKCSPYLIVTLIYFSMRIYVLGGIGGYAERPHGILEISKVLIEILSRYFIVLIYPVDFLKFGTSVSSLSPVAVQIFVILVFGLAFIRGSYHSEKIVKYFVEINHLKAAAFLLIWLFLPLCVYMATLISGRYYLYISTIPFSALLSILLIESYISLVQKIRKGGFGTIHGKLSSVRVSAIIFTSTFVISGSLLLYSPLIKTYGEWKDSGEISDLLFGRIAETLPTLPDNADIYIYDFPDGIASYGNKIPYAKEVEYPAGYSIKSWLDLNFPNNSTKKIVIKSKKTIMAYRDKLSLTVTNDYYKDNIVMFTVEF